MNWGLAKVGLLGMEPYPFSTGQNGRNIGTLAKVGSAAESIQSTQ